MDRRLHTDNEVIRFEMQKISQKDKIGLTLQEHTTPPLLLSLFLS